MTNFLDSIGPAVLRASWQAAILALIVGAFVRLGGERITPRWRYLLWSVVVARLLLVVTPASPWSAFNLAYLLPDTGAPAVTRNDDQPRPAAEKIAFEPPAHFMVDEAVAKDRAIHRTAERLDRAGRALVAPLPSPTARDVRPERAQSVAHRASQLSIVRISSSLYLFGCGLLGLKLWRAAQALRRRFSVCRPVGDGAILAALDDLVQRTGLRATPELLVTPESISPCLVGTIRPRIVLPEVIVTEAPATALRHVLAHELAHLARGDMWTNWVLIFAPIVHWFNPLAWWVVREMQAERERACDDLALAVLAEDDRTSYASTVVDLAASLAPSGIAPAMIGLFASTRRLTTRVERLANATPVKTLRSPLAAAILVGVAMIGLTDAMPAATARHATGEPVTAPQPPSVPQPETVTLRGHCEDFEDKTPIAGAVVRLFKAPGRTEPVVEVAKCVTDRNGRFEFPALVAPRPDAEINRLSYLVFAEANDRPIGVGGFWRGPEGRNSELTIGFGREKTTLAGVVVDPEGKPVAGASVAEWEVDGRPIPGILSATTGSDGRFVITRIDVPKRRQPASRANRGWSFTVSHPRHPQIRVTVPDLPKLVTFKLARGCRVTGKVVDGVAGQAAAGALVFAEQQDEHSETCATTDSAGHFEMPVHEGRYTFLVAVKDRVCAALADQECLAGASLELPVFRLAGGGFIAGKVIDASSRQAIAVTNEGKPIALGLHGPSHPLGKISSPRRLAITDSEGRFKLRAARGENFPYLVNHRGDRMSWDTTRQPAVVVKEGETTEYNMLVTPEVPPAEKLNAARKLVESLPVKPLDRTERILGEFRKLENTVDHTELWCTLMRELVAIGPDAVPQICAELDRATADRTIRRLAFALRAIGDARAIPALIRAIPNTLVPPGSDYGLIVADAQLAAYMQKFDINEARQGGWYFDFGRPVREVFGALHKLSKQNFDDSELFGLHKSSDPRRQWYQRRMLIRQAERWAAWWEAHWREFTNDASYQRVHLHAALDPLPPPTLSPTLGPSARIDDGVHGAVLSPPSEEGAYTEYLYDLDTGAHPKWPAHILRDASMIDPKHVADWAEKNGVDLMCVTHRAADGTQTFALRSFGMKVWEISSHDLRNLDRLIAAGTLPKGRETGELLIHYDEPSKQLEPDANAAFIFVTREGCMGLIETTDRVTRSENIIGMMGDPPRGVGFHKGVRFNLKSIIP